MSELAPQQWHDLYEANKEGLWRLVRFEAEHEPDRVDYYEQLEEIERERRKQERTERIKSLPPPPPSRLTVSEALERLEAVRRSGRGRWMARCPVHEDWTPSLAVTESDARPGEAVVHCFAGCDWRDVMGTLRQ